LSAGPEDGQVAGGLLGVTEGIVGQQGVLAGAIPGLAAEEERPQVRVLEPNGEGMASPRSARVWSAVSSSSRQIRRTPGET
jgi:hypothetical protein